MGQYYFVAFKRGDGKAVVNERKYKNSPYVGAKMMEHSYIGNWFMDAVARDIFKNGRTRIAWVGDYAEDDELRKITNGDVDYDMVWGDHDHEHCFGTHRFGYKGKFLVNHTKRVYISYDKWAKHYKSNKDYNGFILNPLSILTAIGNGRGGGDYGGTNEDKVGTWAWDEISVETKAPLGYKLEDFFFEEK